MKLYKILVNTTRVLLIFYVVVLINLIFPLLDRSTSRSFDNIIMGTLTYLALANLLIGLSQWFKYRKDNDKNKPWFILCVVYGFLVFVLLTIYPLLLPSSFAMPSPDGSM